MKQETLYPPFITLEPLSCAFMKPSITKILSLVDIKQLHALNFSKKSLGKDQVEMENTQRTKQQVSPITHSPNPSGFKLKNKMLLPKALSSLKRVLPKNKL